MNTLFAFRVKEPMMVMLAPAFAVVATEPDIKKFLAIVIAVTGSVFVPAALPLSVRFPYDSFVTVWSAPLYSTVLVMPKECVL